MTRNVLVYAGGGDPTLWCEALTRELPGMRVCPWPEEVVPDYAAVWAPTPAVVEAIRPARAVFLLGAGVDHLAPVMDSLRGVRVLRIEDAGMADQMVEYALLATLEHQRGWHRYGAQQRAGQWVRHPARSRASVTVGVLGLGVLGGAVARALADFGYTLRGWSRRPREVSGVTTYAGEGALGEFLAGCEVLIDVLPVTPATEGLLRRDTLARLPRGATLVNMARGRHVVEGDLLALLDAGHLAHATLDVFAQEPLPEGSPLWGHPKVTVTPHVAALSLPDRCAAQIAAKIARIEAGEPVTGEVDLDAGY
jgi:glyoxylate/hydroxypyruvate reductase A